MLIEVRRRCLTEGRYERKGGRCRTEGGKCPKEGEASAQELKKSFLGYFCQTKLFSESNDVRLQR